MSDPTVMQALDDATRLSHERAVATARRLVGVLATAPSVVPMSDGGVQLEWHAGGLDIEVACSADGEIEWWSEAVQP